MSREHWTTETAKTKRRSSLRFNKFEHEQGARLEKAREMIDGENGIITIWSTEMWVFKLQKYLSNRSFLIARFYREKIISDVKRKIDDRLEREDEYIKKFKFGFEKYQVKTSLI
jgi:hypothetical protein